MCGLQLVQFNAGNASHFRVMKAVASQGVPVPKVLDLCEDSRLLTCYQNEVLSD